MTTTTFKKGDRVTYTMRPGFRFTAEVLTIHRSGRYSIRRHFAIDEDTGLEMNGTYVGDLLNVRPDELSPIPEAVLILEAAAREGREAANRIKEASPDLLAILTEVRDAVMAIQDGKLSFRLLGAIETANRLLGTLGFSSADHLGEQRALEAVPGDVRLYRMSYALDVPEYFDFVVEATSEAEAEALAAAALEAGAFSGVETVAAENVDNPRVFVETSDFPRDEADGYPRLVNNTIVED